MTTGNPILRNLDRSRECWQRNCQKPDSTWIAQPKCHPGRQEDQEMLKIMCGAGCGPDGWGAKGQNDDGGGEQPGHSLKKSFAYDGHRV